MGQLAEKINRDKSTTTVLVRKLEKEGLLEITPDPMDKRSKSVQLTQKGQEYNETTAEISRELLATFFKGFSEEDKEDFFNYLKRIEGNFI